MSSLVVYHVKPKNSIQYIGIKSPTPPDYTTFPKEVFVAATCQEIIPQSLFFIIRTPRRQTIQEVSQPLPQCPKRIGGIHLDPFLIERLRRLTAFCKLVATSQ